LGLVPFLEITVFWTFFLKKKQVSGKLEDMGYAVVACDFSAAALLEAGGEGAGFKFD
jgi:hypothetical protein